jgi:cytochrome c peroxidase
MTLRPIYQTALVTVGLVCSMSSALASPTVTLHLSPPISEQDYFTFDPAKAKIGRLLFYDKVLSGNQNISCGTCHHHELGGADGLSLGVGEGGMGLGPKRKTSDGKTQINARIPRNAPALWNLAHRDVQNMFHDGRLFISDEFGNGFNSPARADLPKGLETIIAAQAMFPITARHEMAGDPQENPIGDASSARLADAWPIIAKRVADIPEYAEMIVAAYDGVDSAEEISIVEIGNSIAAFIGTEWRNFDSPYDQYLAGQTEALSPEEKSGMELFFGEAQCSTCHSGALLTDQDFHAIGLPNFGPGKTNSFDPVARDVGRMLQTNRLEDIYKFRTPPLRNVALTGPYGHNGAMPTLDAMVRHHVDPVTSMQNYTKEMAALPQADWLQDADFTVWKDEYELARQKVMLDIDLPQLNDSQINEIVAFLNALTGETALDLPMGRPGSVPSGLPVD